MSSEDNEKRERIDMTGKTPEEILALADERGYELTEAELDEISGGGWSPNTSTCPKCGSTNIEKRGGTEIECKCLDCGYKWEVLIG